MTNINKLKLIQSFIQIQKKKEKMTRNFDTQLLIDMLLYINIGFYISILCTTSYW